MKTRLPSLTFLIPAYNDEQTIRQAVMEAYDVGKQVSKTFDICVINDASPDKTKDVLADLQKKVKELLVITHTKNKGYGGTIKELYLKGKGEWLFTIPGDYQIGAKEILALLPCSDSADMIMGWRISRNDPEARLRQSKIYNTFIRILFGVKVHDVNSVRLVKSDVIAHTHLTTSSAFVDAELIIRAQRNGYRIAEVPIEHRSRQADEQTAGGNKLRTILPTIWEMMRFFLIGR